LRKQKHKPNKLIKSDKTSDTNKDVLADEPHSDKIEKKEIAQAKSKQPLRTPTHQMGGASSSFCNKDFTFLFLLSVMRMMLS